MRSDIETNIAPVKQFNPILIVSSISLQIFCHIPLKKHRLQEMVQEKRIQNPRVDKGLPMAPTSISEHMVHCVALNTQIDMHKQI